MYAEAGPSSLAPTMAARTRRPRTSTASTAASPLSPTPNSLDLDADAAPLPSSIAAPLSSKQRRTHSSNHGRWAMWAGVVATMVAVLFGGAQAQQGVPNNITTLAGTWTTGSGAVVTGLEFFNPGTGVFTYPKTAGQSYSFTDDGHWEQALYLYETNPAKPSCVSAQLIWQHGTYVLHNNNSLTLTPFKGDGRQQISDRCASQSNRVQSYNQVETMMGFDILLDTHYTRPAYKLQLYEFDGNPKPYMWQVYNPPQMLPTEQLHMEIIGDVAG